MTDPEDPLAWETLDRRTSYACEGFDVLTEAVRLPDGTETEFDFVTEPPSVVVLPLLAGDADAPDATDADGGAGGGSPDESGGDGGESDAPAGDRTRETTGGEDRQVVVIEEWRQAVGRVNRGLPAGGMEPGDDDPTEAAHRELREETGHVADRVEHLVSAEPANGLLDSVFHYFVAHGCRPEAEQVLDYNESIRVTTSPLSHLRAAVARGELRDGRSALGILYHQLHG